MPRRRRNEPSPFSLFAFQDIITSVMGIVVLITLILAMELLSSAAESAEVRTVERLDAMTLAKDETERELAVLQARLQMSSADFENLPTLDLQTLRRRATASQRIVDELSGRLAARSAELSAATRRRLAAEDAAKSDREALERETVDLEQSIRDLNEALSRLSDPGRLIFDFETDARRVWVVQVDEDGALAAEYGQAATPRRLSTQASFDRFARTLSSDEAIYFVVKPGGASWFDAAQDSLRSGGAAVDYGFTVVSTSESAVNPQSGASLP